MNELTLTARQLRELVDPVVPLAARTGDLPVLNTVLVETRGEYVTATATDRFRLGICRIKLGTDDEPVVPPMGFRALIGLRELRTILAFFKSDRYSNPSLKLKQETESLTVSQAGAFDGVLGAELTIELARGEYPTIVSVLRDALALTEPQTEQSFNAAFLADFKHAIRHGESLTVRMGRGRTPAVVTVGEHFVGAIMPRTDVHGAEGVRDQWLTFLADVAGKKAS